MVLCGSAAYSILAVGFRLYIFPYDGTPPSTLDDGGLAGGVYVYPGGMLGEPGAQ